MKSYHKNLHRLRKWWLRWWVEEVVLHPGIKVWPTTLSPLSCPRCSKTWRMKARERRTTNNLPAKDRLIHRVATWMECHLTWRILLKIWWAAWAAVRVAQVVPTWAAWSKWCLNSMNSLRIQKATRIWRVLWTPWSMNCSTKIHFMSPWKLWWMNTRPGWRLIGIRYLRKSWRITIVSWIRSRRFASSTRSTRPLTRQSSLKSLKCWRSCKN